MIEQHLRKASQRQLSSRVSSLGCLTSLRAMLYSLMAASNCSHTSPVKIGYVNPLAILGCRAERNSAFVENLDSDDTSW